MTGAHAAGMLPATRHVIVMGVSGSGKTTVAEAIAARCGLEFADADGFHPPANVAKMEAGQPLTDEDRWPWLRELASWMAQRSAAGVSTIMACSALRRAYRDLLRDGPPSLDFVHLDGPADVIRDRMADRKGHFMPTSLLESQLRTLEPLQSDEAGVVLDLRDPVDELADQAVAALRLPRLPEGVSDRSSPGGGA